MEKVHFKGGTRDSFLSEVRSAVEKYFLDKNMDKTATGFIYFKTILLAVSSLLLYCTLLFGWCPWMPRVGIWCLFGIVQMLIAVNVGHDALHGSYSSREWINRLLGYWAYDCLGMSSHVWKQTHNREHHTFTNIAGIDPDIHKPGVLRLCPHDPHFKVHRFQHLYVWLLYALVSLNWVYVSDWAYFLENRKKASWAQRVNFVFFKLLHVFLYFGVMLLWSPMSWIQIFSGYFAMHCIGGVFAATVFQLAHVVEDVSFPLPDSSGVIGVPWSVHELDTTSNFAVDSFWVTHFVGGLNFQIEHHLLPKISHVHYPVVSKIVRELAMKHGLPYHKKPTLRSAVASHARLLRDLGNQNCVSC